MQSAKKTKARLKVVRAEQPGTNAATSGQPVSPAPDVVANVRDAGLHYVTPEKPGIARRRAGKGFSYWDASGKPIKDAATLDRIRKLVLPPAWENVWICADPRGHLQA